MSQPQRDLRKNGLHVNGLPVRLAFPASVTFTRPSHLVVEGIGVLPMYVKDEAEKEFGAERVSVVREEYEVAERHGRRY